MQKICRNRYSKLRAAAKSTTGAPAERTIRCSSAERRLFGSDTRNVTVLDKVAVAWLDERCLAHCSRLDQIVRPNLQTGLHQIDQSFRWSKECAQPCHTVIRAHPTAIAAK